MEKQRYSEFEFFICTCWWSLSFIIKSLAGCCMSCPDAYVAYCYRTATVYYGWHQWNDTTPT